MKSQRFAAATLAAAAALVFGALPVGAASLEGFEVPQLPDNTHTYTPTGSSWTFGGVTGRGIQRNGSPFLAPAAPEGQQTAFLKGNDGSVSRSVTLPAGTYKVSFSAARRSSSTVINPVQVWVDGVAVGTAISPTSTNFVRYTSAPVTLTTGAHTLKLSTTRAGDYTTLLDAVSIDLINPFDARYAPDFKLKPPGTEAQPTVAKPASKATGLDAASYIDPVYGTRVYRATAASDRPESAFVRHEYSRRQAFNANNTRPSQSGFSQPTSTTMTNDNGMTFCCGVGAACRHPGRRLRLWSAPGFIDGRRRTGECRSDQASGSAPGQNRAADPGCSATRGAASG